jgi:hypothetical protein
MNFPLAGNCIMWSNKHSLYSSSGDWIQSPNNDKNISLLAFQPPDAAANPIKFCWFQWCLCWVHLHVIYWPLSMALTKNLHLDLVWTINSSMSFKMCWHKKQFEMIALSKTAIKDLKGFPNICNTKRCWCLNKVSTTHTGLWCHINNIYYI